MREKITFEERVEVKLGHAKAKPVASHSGATEYMRVCDDDKRIMFAPAALEAAIKASGAEAGDLISIDRLHQGKKEVWDVAIISEPPQQQPETRKARQAAAPPPPATPARPAASGPADHAAVRMSEAFAAAIIATAEAEAHAARAGIRDLSLCDPDTITRVALSIFIESGRR